MNIRGTRAHAKEWIADFEAGERWRTGMTPKVDSNRVFGYYIEVNDQVNLKRWPEDYIRQTTLRIGECHITRS